jgi:hypothetical protein
MAYHIDKQHLPRIYNYQDAKDLFERITPIRGGDQSLRRIAKRNDASKWLEHEVVDGIDIYTAGLHRSGLISYYPTHYEITMDGWGSMSTMLYITAVTGRVCTGIPTRDYIPQGFSESLMEASFSYNGYPIHTSGTYKFDYDNKPLDLDAHPKLVKYKVNRKRMNEVRRMAKPFYEYVDAMNNLMDADMNTGGRDNHWDSPYRNTAHMIADIENQDKWWEMFQCLAWQTQSSKYDFDLGKMVYTRNIGAMKHKIDIELKYNSPHVLDAV